MRLSAVKSPHEEFVLEEFLPYRLSLLSNTVSQGISTAYRRVHGLSVTEWRVVAILGRFPGLTATEVKRRTAMDKVAVSRAVKKLQEQALIERSPQADDRRRMPLKLTADKGMRLFREVVPKAMDYEQQLLAALSPDELTRLRRMILKLQSKAEDLNGENP
jgi:DNA-binding MarR family transcriptional regulator